MTEVFYSLVHSQDGSNSQGWASLTEVRSQELRGVIPQGRWGSEALEPFSAPGALPSWHGSRNPNQEQSQSGPQPDPVWDASITSPSLAYCAECLALQFFVSFSSPLACERRGTASCLLGSRPWCLDRISCVCVELINEPLPGVSSLYVKWHL